MDQLNLDRGLPMADSSAANCEFPRQEEGGAQVHRQSAIRNPQSILGYLIAFGGLLWVLHDIQPTRLFGQLTQINWWWIALALVCDVGSYICQGARWQLLLRPIGKVSMVQSTQAIYAGLFTNEILPMRLGELVRAYLVSRWVAAKFVTVIPSLVVERLFDGIWMAVGIGLVAMFVQLPDDLLVAGDTLGVIAILAVGLFTWYAFRQARSARSARPERKGRLSDWKPLRLLRELAGKMSEGLNGIGRTRAFYFSFALSLGLLVLQTLAFWLVMLGYGIRLSFWAGVAVFLIVHLGTAIPNAPANVGSYQFFTVLGLTLFGVDKTYATGFSLVVFVLLTLPLLLIGFVALSRSGMTLVKIRQEVSGLIAR